MESYARVMQAVWEWVEKYGVGVLTVSPHEEKKKEEEREVGCFITCEDASKTLVALRDLCKCSSSEPMGALLAPAGICAGLGEPGSSGSNAGLGERVWKGGFSWAQEFMAADQAQIGS